MNLRLIRHTWGTNGSWAELFSAFQRAGYHGIETSIPAAGEQGEFQELRDQYGFDLVLQIHTSGRGVDEHLASFRHQLDAALPLHPRVINSHSGLDAWSDAESEKFFAGALAAEQAAGLPICHETHRGRVFYNPWVCRRMMDRFSNLKLCCDFSHWVCVCERLFDEDLEQIAAQCAPRCLHLHARVGHEQGPQVSDPAAAEFAPQLAAHERWWKMIWDAQHARGDAVTTLTPEFGPPPYAPTLPGTNTPLRDVAEVCDWVANRQAARFASLGYGTAR